MTLNLNGSSSGSVSIDAPASTTGGADVTLTLPVDDGTANQFLQTNGSGVLSFAGVNQGRGAFSIQVDANQSFAHNTWTKANFNTEVFDVDNWYDTTNIRYTPQIAGYYQINYNGRISTNSGSIEALIGLYENGSLKYTGGTASNGYGGTCFPSASWLVYLDGSDDYIEPWLYQYNGGSGNRNLYASGTTNVSHFSGFLAYPT